MKSKHCYRTTKKHWLCKKTKKYSSINSVAWMSSLSDDYFYAGVNSCVIRFTLPVGTSANSVWFCIPRVPGSKFQEWFPVLVKPFYWDPREMRSLDSGICRPQWNNPLLAKKNKPLASRLARCGHGSNFVKRTWARKTTKDILLSCNGLYMF